MKTRRLGSSAARFALGIALLLLTALPSRAQEVLWPTTGEWRVFETEHFRLHFPVDSEEWARHAAARLEAIRDRVAAEVGYEPPQTVDVVVSDPVAEPNGSAWPFLGEPRMVLWTSPPGPESVLNHYADWTELLIVHEETHLVHLLRPSRNPIRQLLSRAVPVGPILFTPRWVSEGYATVVEGRLTGFGRPNGDLRASILRRRAQMGKLPTYSQMASDSSTYLGQVMAYLMGSAYLEWLEERTGPGSLRNLWSRMTAREARSFDEAFEGVFGDSPQNLYGRFTAELTWRAMEAERLRAAERKEGTFWQDFSWTTGGPAVSPDGERLAVVLDDKDDPSKLVVLSTGPNDEAEKKAREAQEKALARDPQDVAAVRTRPLGRKPLFTLPSTDGVSPGTPRWMPDGKSILFVRFEPDLQGFSHPDLFLWTLESGEVRRLTHDADLREPDPSPDGRWAVAVRRAHGLSRLVRVDLATGETRDLTEPILTGTYEQPRVSPDGTRIATVRHEEGRWRLVVLDAETGQPVGNRSGETAPPREATLAFPAWSRDGKTIYATVGERGFIDLYAFPADPGSGPIVPLTRTQGAAFSPEPLPDGSGLFYLSLEPDGLDLYRLNLPPAATDAAAAASVAASPGSPAAELPAGLAPAVRPATPAAQEPFQQAEVAPDRPYGLGRQTYGLMVGGSLTSSGGVWELGLRGGDVLGRLQYLAFGSLSGDGWPEGGALAAKYRGWPVALGVHLFDADSRPSELSDRPPGLGRGLDLDRRGVELSAEWTPVWSGERSIAEARLYRGQVETAGSGRTLDQEIGELGGGYTLYRQLGDWKLDGGAGLHYEAGRTDGDGWTRYGGQVRLGLGNGGSRLALTWRRDGSSDLRQSFDLYQLGGAATSVLPQILLTNRIEVPALPEGTLRGDEHEGQRADLKLGFLPVPLFYERHRLWFDGWDRGDWQALAGFEGRFSIGPVPVVGLPELELRVGGARILDEPFKDDNRWWLITVWRP